ncbi:MAG: protein kinase [Victivallales bacterium]|nr:protein kinase [Victivallales bacterium]
MIVQKPNELSDDLEVKTGVVENNVNSNGTGSFNESQLNFLRCANLGRRDYLFEEIPVMHQRSAAVAFFSDLLELFGVRKYDHQYDIDDSSISLEVSEDEHCADASSFHDESTIGDLEKNYPLLKDVGKGGQGTIVAAEDLQFGRRVAIKSLKNSENPKARGAFFNEARITAHLEHPAIVPIHNLYVDHENVPHLVMKYVEGKSFRERIAKIKKKYSPLSWYQICTVERWQRKLRIEHFLRVCEAIEYAHNRNVLHCDLKPENIMVGRFGELYVMDWGMARVIPKGQDWIITSAAGTPRYIAPEVLQHRPYGKTADIYQLGLLLYETVFLRRAFPWRDKTIVLECVKAGELSPMAHYFGCHVPSVLKRIIRKATALDPLDRYQEVADLAADLRGYLKNEATSVELFPRWSRFTRMLARYSAALLVLFLLVTAVCCGGIIFNLRQQVAKKIVSEEQHTVLKRIYSSNMRTGIQVEHEIVQLEDDLLELCREASARLGHLERPNSSYHYYRGTEGVAEEPPGYGYQPSLGKQASFRAFGWHVPIDAGEIPALDSILSTLYPMLPSFVKMTTEHFRIRKEGQTELAGIDLSEERTPVVSTMLGFSNDLLFAYPFEGHRDSNFRVTQQKWYVRAIEDFADRPVWTGPMVDPIVKNRLLMCCSAPVVNVHDERIGAAVTMLDPASILDLFAQKLTSSLEIKARYLVHFSGDIYATDAQDLKPSVQDGKVVCHPFPATEQFSKMWELHTGRLFQDEKAETLFIFVRLESLGCVYIEEIDFSHARQFDLLDADDELTEE